MYLFITIFMFYLLMFAAIDPFRLVFFFFFLKIMYLSLYFIYVLFIDWFSIISSFFNESTFI